MPEFNSETTPHLLIVDDDPGIRELLSLYLGEQGYDVGSVEDGAAMDLYLAQHNPHLLILDLMLPGEDGLSLIRRLHASRPDMPIIMISARGEDIDRIVGLEVGADDYLAKPFNPRELLARIRSLLRRQAVAVPESCVATDTAETNTPCHLFGPFVLDPLRRVLQRDGIEVTLSRAEFELLLVFNQHPNRILNRDAIMAALGRDERDAFDRSIDVRVTRLRKKIEADPGHPCFLRTVWGIGYQFTPAGDNA